ncbi:helix-turn-helix domain-containing protein [Streptomyces tauricus]|uniref:helix-turn-helix domain-containing protein n=1 Tax=Streptomyces TaxID=1883 RepID=UPI0033A96F08
MSVRETAKYINMSASWVYKSGRRSGLVSYRFGRGSNAKIQFKESEVKAWMRQRRE